MSNHQSVSPSLLPLGSINPGDPLTPYERECLNRFCKTGINVHLVQADGPHIAATITHVIDIVKGTVYLQTFYPPVLDRTTAKSEFSYSPERHPGTWHFIEDGVEEILVRHGIR
jgi:hypothetical protein